MARFNLADLLLASGRPAEAADCYREALALRPDNHQARINLALSLDAAGQDRAAVNELRDLLRQVPDSVETRLRLAWLVATSEDARVRDPREAARLAAEAVQLTGARVPEVLEAQAQVLAAVGSSEEARAALEQAERMRATHRAPS
jgi:tetratricopeptide (TPR) repeat protein